MKILNINAKLLVFNIRMNAIAFLLMIFFNFMHLGASLIFNVIFSYLVYSRYFLIPLATSSLAPELFRSMLVNHKFCKFPGISWLLISSFILGWSEHTLCQISIHQNFLRFVLWSRIWFILMTIKCQLRHIGS